MKEKRRNPESLLKQAQKEEQEASLGKLKIYLGSAPGVGKTYAMLEDALQKRAKDLDIVVGVVESHGRREIDEMLKQFEIIPKQTIQYRGQTLTEFDLDAVIKRHPGIVLIDEMAHTNAPGLRHAKRWQDIKEILAYGIDVYTTLNVQHIESLNDVVSQIIHTRVKETIPDLMLEIADTIELIDLPPEELLKRLQEGKVYIPTQAEVAVEHFFRKGNLIALRELALRVTAERVSAQVLLYRKGLGIKHIWPTKEKLLVCVGTNMQSAKLIRAARRMATSLKTEWIAVHVNQGETDEQYASAIQNLRLAEQLGGQTKILTGLNIVNEIMTFAREQNINKIIVGKYRRSWRKLFSRHLTNQIIRQSDEIDVYLITEQIEIKSLKPTSIKKPVAWYFYGIAVSVVGIATLINVLLSSYLNPSNTIMVYLLGIVAVALMGKTKPAVLASILSIIGYAFFFMPHLYFDVRDLQYFFTLLVMMLITFTITHLTLLMHRQANAAHAAEKRTAVLHVLSQQLAGTRGIDKLLAAGLRYIGDTFNCTVVALIADHGQLTIRAAFRTEKKINEKEESIAHWVYELGQSAGFGTETLPFSNALYIPLLGSRGTLGVLQVYPFTAKQLFTPEQMHLLEACANQIAIAIEVDHLQEETQQSELKMETDRVRTALLHSVAHNLRTPLIASIGAANTLIEMADSLDETKIKKLGTEINIELDEVNHLINNLLQITYLEAADVKLEKKLHSLKFVISAVLKTATHKWIKNLIQVDLPEDLPKIPFDLTLIQEVFINLIDNAIKFSPPESTIDITAAVDSNKIIVNIEDQGPGIMPDEVNKLFDKFYRGRLITTERGLGLGLAICLSIIKAHGGEIWAENKPNGGAAFRFSLPL